MVFCKNEWGCIYGVIFIDYNYWEVFNGLCMGKVFFVNVFNDYFKWLENIFEKEWGGYFVIEFW